MEINQLTKQIISAAIEVHKILGPGLLESAYEQCLCHEFELRKLAYERQKFLPVFYKGQELDCGYRIDVLVEGSVLLELKCCESLQQIHRAQVLTYLKLLDLRLGLLLNFNVPLMKKGIVRVLNGILEDQPRAAQ